MVLVFPAISQRVLQIGIKKKTASDKRGRITRLITVYHFSGATLSIFDTVMNTEKVFHWRPPHENILVLAHGDQRLFAAPAKTLFKFSCQRYHSTIPLKAVTSSSKSRSITALPPKDSANFSPAQQILSARTLIAGFNNKTIAQHGGIIGRLSQRQFTGCVQAMRCLRMHTIPLFAPVFRSQSLSLAVTTSPANAIGRIQTLRGAAPQRMRSVSTVLQRFTSVGSSSTADRDRSRGAKDQALCLL